MTPLRSLRAAEDEQASWRETSPSWKTKRDLRSGVGRCREDIVPSFAPGAEESKKYVDASAKVDVYAGRRGASRLFYESLLR